MRNRKTESKGQKAEYITEDTRRREEGCPSTSSGRTIFFPIMLSLSKHLRAILTLCTLLIITACGGGGEGSNSTTPSGTIVFSGSTPGSNTVYMAYNSSLSSGDTVAVDVKTNNISGSVYGTAFDMDFDSSKITYSSYANGSFLEQEGNTATYQVALQSGNSGKLVVGISRQGNVSGASGSGALITLKFRVVGSSSLSFSDNELRDSSNQVISTTWYGGEVTVQ